MAATIERIYRYPVKGLSPEALSAADISARQTLKFDRAYAIENGSRQFDPAKPGHMPKIKFLQLMSNQQLAALETRFDETDHTLSILRDGKQVARGNLSMPIGRTLIEQFLAAYMGADARGTPRIVSAPDHHFCDVPARVLSLINLATVRDIERVAGKPVDPLRFRANIYVDGLAAWQEFHWLGKEILLAGKPAFQVLERIERCAATNVDPATGARDMHIPRILSDVFDHQDCGVYLTAIADGRIHRGDEFSIAN